MLAATQCWNSAAFDENCGPEVWHEGCTCLSQRLKRRSRNIRIRSLLTKRMPKKYLPNHPMLTIRSDWPSFYEFQRIVDFESHGKFDDVGW